MVSPGNRTLALREAVINLNHFANVKRLLNCGKTIQGLLRSVGSEPIPAAFVHGVSFPATIIVVDQNGNCYPSEVKLWADRSEGGLRKKPAPKTLDSTIMRPKFFSLKKPGSEKRGPAAARTPFIRSGWPGFVCPGF
jgi:hypothetical protein